MRVLSDNGWFIWGLVAIFCTDLSLQLALLECGWPSIVGALIAGVLVGIITWLAVIKLREYDECSN